MTETHKFGGNWTEEKLKRVKKFKKQSIVFAVFRIGQSTGRKNRNKNCTGYFKEAIMSKNSSIEWTESTWNPITGCSKISPGCKNCYAERMAKRLKAMG